VLENPMANLTALNRAGITFTQVEKDKITALQKSGKLFEAQDMVLKSIESRVSGLAEASATPFEKLTAQFNQIGDAIGEGLLVPLEEMNQKVRVWLSSPQSKKDIQDITDAFVAMGEAAKFTLDIILNIKKGMDEITKFNRSWVGGLSNIQDTIIGRTPSVGGGNPSAPGGRPGRPATGPFGGTSRGLVVNFNSPIDSVSAGREISRVLKEYDRSNGGRRR
jgi:hypothetical protein